MFADRRIAMSREIRVNPFNRITRQKGGNWLGAVAYSMPKADYTTQS